MIHKVRNYEQNRLIRTAAGIPNRNVKRLANIAVIEAVNKSEALRMAVDVGLDELERRNGITREETDTNQPQNRIF